MFDLVEFKREELHIIRNNHQVARIVPGPATMTALEALGDLYRTIPDDAASEWVSDGKGSSEDTLSALRDPWASS